MRYLGNKWKLLQEIFNLIQKNCDKNCNILCDAFSWTSVVGDFFKHQYQIIANDIQYYSYVISQAKLNTPDLQFTKLGEDPFKIFNQENLYLQWFITNNYSPLGWRQYFSEENAGKIDYIRTTIEQRKNEQKLTEDEYFYLLACLLESVSKVANIAWVYGAFLKTRDPRALKIMKFIPVEQEDLKKYHDAQVFNAKIEDLIDNIQWDILYLDPPYTKNQYSVQYHLLETIAKNDQPIIKGKWWLRDTSDTASDWAREWNVHVIFNKIIASAKFRYIILSYNSDGLMSKKYIENIFKRYGEENTFQCIEIPYKQYKNHQTWEKENHYEYLFFVKKKAKTAISFASPLNYQWWKHDLIAFIKQNLPNRKIKTFIDLFWWWYNVWINIDAERHIYNDGNHKVVELINTFYNTNPIDLVKYVLKWKKQYHLEFADKDNYLKLRDLYNSIPLEQRDPKMLYLLILYGFNQQIRFNSSYDYNNPVWPTWLTDNNFEKLISFCEKIQSQKLQFFSYYFDLLDIQITQEDFVYCDPPYLITLWSYNDGKRWFFGRSENDEIRLYQYLQKLHQQGIQWMLSNVLEHKGKQNELLKNWIQKNHFRLIECEWKTRKGRKEILVVNYSKW